MSRLTKEQLEARGLVLAGMVGQEATIAALRAENARLSEALEACRFQLNGGGPPHSEWRTKLMRQIDAALSGEIRAEPQQ